MSQNGFMPDGAVWLTSSGATGGVGSFWLTDGVMPGGFDLRMRRTIDTDGHLLTFSPWLIVVYDIDPEMGRDPEVEPEVTLPPLKAVAAAGPATSVPAGRNPFAR